MIRLPRTKALVLGFFWLVGLTTYTIADEPPKALQSALANRDFRGALLEVRKLPAQERVQWLKPMLDLQQHDLTNKESNQPSRSTPSSEGAGLDQAKTSRFLDQGETGGGGGGAQFGPLIRLIMNTIDGDWEQDGGSDTLEPFASGVWIDAKGMLQSRVRHDLRPVTGNVEVNEALISLASANLLPSQVDCRWISLTRLLSRLQDRQKSGQAIQPAMELLGGLARVDFVAWREETNEWLLGGPAGSFSVNADGELVDENLGLPPVLLEDLVAVASHVFQGKGALGCSIDPEKEKLLAAQQFIASPSSRKKLLAAPQKWTEQLIDELGPQQVSITGLDDDSPTALALLVADQHMKRIGLGLEAAPKGMRDYFQQIELTGGNTNQSMVRWWFAIASMQIERDRESSVFSIPSESVAVMSDKEFMDHTGKRASSNEKDAAADAFAKEFTKRFAEIEKRYVCYGRLHHIVNLAIAMEIVRTEAESRNRGTLTGFSDPEMQYHLRAKPLTVPSVGTHRILAKSGSKQTLVMVSGGVVLNPRSSIKQFSDASRELPNLTHLELTDRYDANNDWMLEAKRP